MKNNVLLIFLTILFFACDSSQKDYTPVGYYFESRNSIGVKIESFTYIAPNGKFYQKTYFDGEEEAFGGDEGTWEIIELSTAGLTNKKTESFIVFKNGRKFIFQIFDDCFGLPESGYEKSIIGNYTIPESDFLSKMNISGSPFNSPSVLNECFEKTTKHSKLFDDLFSNVKIENKDYSSDKIISRQADLSNEKSKIFTDTVNIKQKPLITPDDVHLIKDKWISTQESSYILNFDGSNVIYKDNNIKIPKKIRFFPDNIVEMELNVEEDKYYKGFYTGENVREFSVHPDLNTEETITSSNLKYVFSYVGFEFDMLELIDIKDEVDNYYLKDIRKVRYFRESSKKGKANINTKVKTIEVIEDSVVSNDDETYNTDDVNIHESLENYKNLVYSFMTSKFLIRIDELEDNSYRYVSWNKSSKFKDKPSLVLKNGERFYEGSGGNNYFLFKSGAYSYKIWENKVSAKTSAYTLEVYQNKKIIVEQESIE